MLYALLINEGAQHLIEALVKAGDELGLDTSPPEATEELMEAILPEVEDHHQHKPKPKKHQHINFGKRGKRQY